METFNIAILDDSKSKVDTIRVLFMQQSDRAEKCYDGRYSDYNLQLKPINIEKSCDQIIDEIISSKFDAIIIDYQLDSSGIISDNGITIATRIKERFSEYPLFILTAYEDSLFRNEVFDAYQVYNYENYVNNVTATKEFHCHIIEQTPVVFPEKNPLSRLREYGYRLQHISQLPEVFLLLYILQKRNQQVLKMSILPVVEKPIPATVPGYMHFPE